ncbi:MAG TPA: D-alanine--D-alanine ligase [Phycisphaerae bacterium]|nr:D-alanine--D-alanine ligase [Phycisphaerales bacterium]HNO79321.1 D-alanine--D-alanine ligase [Phycisphaerae bacterium]
MRRETRPVRIGPHNQSVRVNHLDITLLSGGPSSEREVSLASGRSIGAALSRLGHRVSICDISPDRMSALDRAADLVFIALHGEFGEDGKLQAELERRGLRFTGSGSTASALVMDKVRTKGALIGAGLPTPRFDIARKATLSEVIRRWRLPVVVKPVSSGSSIDVFLVHEGDRFEDALRSVVRKYDTALIEELVDGPELTVGILGSEALPPIQIRTKRAFYDYEAKYIDDATEYNLDIDLPADLLSRIQAMSLKAATALGCRDFCRVDWMVDKITHEPYILELNTIPGFTSHSLLPKAAAHSGMAFDDLCQAIVEFAMKRSGN